MCTTNKKEKKKKEEGKTEKLLTRIWIGEEITPTDFM